MKNSTREWLIRLSVGLIFFALGAFVMQAFGQTVTVENVVDDKAKTYVIVETTTYDDGRRAIKESAPFPDSLISLSIEAEADRLAAKIQIGREQAKEDSTQLKKKEREYEERTGRSYSEKVTDYLDKYLEGDWVLKYDTIKLQLTYKNGKFRQKDGVNFGIKALAKNAFQLRKLAEKPIYFIENDRVKWIGKEEDTRYVLRRK